MTLQESSLFGVRLCVGNMTKAVQAISAHARRRQGGMVCVANVDMLTRAKRTHRLMDIMARATFVVTDGMPLVWAMRVLRGFGGAERVYGPGLVLALCEEAARTGTGVFFYGGNHNEAELLQARLLTQFPNLLISGAVVPPMLPTHPPVDGDIIEKINNSGASIVFVGLGCPKQEFWMDSHQQELKPISIGVGLAFALIAGTKKQAPHWMRSSGLEWLFRLFQEPGRLWKRYLVGNSLFIWYVLCDLLKQPLKRKDAA